MRIDRTSFLHFFLVFSFLFVLLLCSYLHIPFCKRTWRLGCLRRETQDSLSPDTTW